MKEFFLWYTCCHQIWSQFSFTRMVHCTWMFISISCFYGKEEIFSWWFFSQLLFPFLLTICSHWIFTWFFFFNVFIFFIMFALFIVSLLSIFIFFNFFLHMWYHEVLIIQYLEWEFYCNFICILWSR